MLRGKDIDSERDLEIVSDRKGKINFQIPPRIKIFPSQHLPTPLNTKSEFVLGGVERCWEVLGGVERCWEVLRGVERDRVLGGIRDPVLDPFLGLISCTRSYKKRAKSVNA